MLLCVFLSCEKNKHRLSVCFNTKIDTADLMSEIKNNGTLYKHNSEDSETETTSTLQQKMSPLAPNQS